MMVETKEERLAKVRKFATGYGDYVKRFETQTAAAADMLNELKTAERNLFADDVNGRTRVQIARSLRMKSENFFGGDK